MEDVSKVYFSDLRTNAKSNLLDKLRKLIIQAQIDRINFDKKFVAIKIHFGEPGNLAFIRPNFVKVLAEYIKSKGGIPFLTDSNTLYKGRRSNGIDHLRSALENGFGYCVTGCDVVIADGVKGTDVAEISIDLKHIKNARIGKAIADADIVISLNHFKGHEMACFGGCLKNLGMGCASVGGKLEMHSDSKPRIAEENCTSCKVCVNNCAHDAIHLNESRLAFIDYNKCTGCGQCIAVCQYDAAVVQWNAKSMQEKVAEYAMAATKDKPCFHINFVMDVSPNCDCWGNNDAAIIPNIGMFASFDPVALDRACVDAAHKAPVLKHSVIGESCMPDQDRFIAAHPGTDWKLSLDYAEKIGLGSQKYELISCK